jgi:HK97 family phage major capsid protein
MEEKELLLKEVTEKVKAELGMFASKADLEQAVKNSQVELTEKFKGVEGLQKTIETLTKAAEKQGEALELMKNKPTNEPLTIKQQLEAQSDVIKRIVSGDTTAKTTVLPTGIASNYNGLVIPGIGQMNYRTPVIQNLFSQSGIGSNNQRTIRYMDQTTTTSAAAARTIGNAAAETAIAWTGYNLSIESISVLIPVALEMLENYDFVQSEINNWLVKDLLLKIEDLVLNGTGSTPQIKGLGTSATAFAINGSTKVKTPTVMDLIIYAATLIGNNSAYRANTVIMNNFDAMKMKLDKDSLGRLLYPNMMSSDGMSVDGIRIVATPLVPADTMYVGDFSQGTFYSNGISVTMGLNSDDFSKRKVTMLANTDCALLIKALNADAFIKSTISTDLGAITQSGN